MLVDASAHFVFQGGLIALVAASSRGNKSIVECLLTDSRVDVNMQDKVKKRWCELSTSSLVPQKGWTALMGVSHRGDVTIVKTLLAIANVNLNIQNNVSEFLRYC